MTIEGVVPWPRGLADEYRRSGVWAGITLADAFEDAVRRHADAIALVDGDRRLTYAELGARVERVARSLAARGICDGARVLMQLPNCAEFVIAYFACMKVGAIPVSCMPHHRYAEISAIGALAEASAWIFASTHRGFDFVALCQAVRPSLPSLREVFVVGDVAGSGMTPFDQLLEPAAEGSLERHRPDPSMPALLQLSGGTTGLSKLIPRTHDDYLYNSLQYATVSGFGRDDVLLVSVPIAHNFPLRSLQGALFAGARVVLARSPSPDLVLPLIEAEKVTYVPAVPATLIEWANAVRSRPAMASLRAIYVGGQRLQPEAARHALATFGPVIRQSFGMAEGLECCSRPDDPLELQLTTQGRPISPLDETRIVDDDDRDVPAGSVGELLCRGPYTIRGYFRAPLHNKDAFSPDGYYRTGDLVRVHASGNFVVEGRKKDVINRGGEKISAEEVENYILGHSAVASVAVVSVPDAVLGERACACLVLKTGRTLTLNELTVFLRDEVRLSPSKLPERLELRDALPATGVGKVSKVALREELRRKIEAEKAALLETSGGHTEGRQ